MRLFLKLVMLIALVIPATGYARVIAESDTGIIFSGGDCKITEAEIIDAWFYREYFDYLSAAVTIKYKCVDLNGLVWSRTDNDVTIFPTLQFNPMQQAWVTDHITVAKDVPFGRITLEPGVSSAVVTDIEDEFISFSTQIFAD